MTNPVPVTTTAGIAADGSATDARFEKPSHGWRRALFSVIFESDSRAGRLFDIALIAVIVASVAVVILDSVQPIRERAGHVFAVFEWIFTALFTIEYIGRLACVQRPLRYATSFYGVIDLLALLPTFLVALAPEFAYLAEMARQGPDDGPMPVAPRGVLAMLPPEPSLPARRLTPAARRRALGQHRRASR